MIEETHPLVGTWVTMDEDSDAAFVVAVLNGEFRVSGFSQSDGEYFVIDELNWNGFELRFHATMPSTNAKTRNCIRLLPDGYAQFEYTVYEVWKKKDVLPGQIPKGWESH